MTRDTPYRSTVLDGAQRMLPSNPLVKIIAATRERWGVDLFDQQPVVHLQDTVAHPVWFTPFASASRQYRAALPAKAAGGAVCDHLAVTHGAPPRTVRLGPWDVQTSGAVMEAELQACGRASAVVVHGLGPVLVLQGSWFYSNLSFLPLLRGVVKAGVHVWLDLDDSIDTAALLDAYWPLQHLLGVLGWGGRIFPDEVQAELRSNLETLLRTVLRLVDGVTVATHPLAAAVRQVNQTVDVRVLPNAVDPADVAVTAPRTDGPVRIGYAGGPWHATDLATLALSALFELARRPDVTLTLYGYDPHRAQDAQSLHSGSHTNRDGVPYFYYAYTSSLREHYRRIAPLDIAVLPLLDTPINQTRSAQKWMDHALHGTATIVSDLGLPAAQRHHEPYAPVQHGVTGLRARTAEEFRTYLHQLVDDAELRRRIGEAARADVLANHSLAAVTPRWQQWADGAARFSRREAANRRYEAADKRYREALAGLETARAARFR